MCMVSYLVEIGHHNWMVILLQIIHICSLRVENEWEPSMKHVVTKLGSPNKEIPFGRSPHASHCVDTFFGDFQEDISPFAKNPQHSEILNYAQIANPIPNSLESCNPNIERNNNFWSLYFDGSKSKEGVGVSCIIEDPKENKTLLVCRIEFEYTNNIAKYKVLIHGLRKAIDLNITCLKVFGNSVIIVM